MLNKRANSSLIAILVILLVIAGVIYLFWQSTLTVPTEEVETPVTVEETVNEAETPVVTEEELTDEEVVVLEDTTMEEETIAEEVTEETAE